MHHEGHTTVCPIIFLGINHQHYVIDNEYIAPSVIVSLTVGHEHFHKDLSTHPVIDLITNTLLHTNE